MISASIWEHKFPRKAGLESRERNIIEHGGDRGMLMMFVWVEVDQIMVVRGEGVGNNAIRWIHLDTFLELYLRIAKTRPPETT